MAAQPQADAASAHLAGLLDWLRRLLLWHLELTRSTYGPLADDAYKGLYIPSAEVDILAEGPLDLPPELAARRSELAAERATLEAWASAAEAAGAALPLRRLARLFGLSTLEADALLVALAPELDLRFERIYAYIQDDVSRRRPSVELALRLLIAAPVERLAALASFEHDGPLVHHRLLLLFEDGQRRPPLLAQFLKLDERIAAELRAARPSLDAAIAPFTTLSEPRRPLADLILPPQLVAGLRQTAGDGVLLALQGPYGSGRRALAEALCAALGRPLLEVNLAELSLDDPAGRSAAELLERTVREARLRGAAILWRDAPRLDGLEPASALAGPLLAAFDQHAGPGFLILDQPWEAGALLRRARYMRVELPELSYGEREQIWARHLGPEAPDRATIEALASTFRLTGGQIRDAAAMARSLAHWRTGNGAPVGRHELFAACRAQSSGRLNALAQKIRGTYSWADIVLPPDQVTQLQEICLQVRHRRTVLERWGFDKRLAMGKGVNVLFAGPSGTGKTMAAEIVAAELGYELYKIDLASMVSKYIGETEKNLDKVFSAAREANALLFFDEADAIFGKRSEVKDAHDRYANIEVGYLLQKMEEYDGVVILATNLRKNLDDAFVRRLHVAVDFPFPEEPDRLRIWRKVFPPEAELAADIDPGFLARQFKLAGGNIRNAALLAAYLAAEDGTPIGMVHIARAIRREYQKIGKLVTEAEFGRYMAYVRSEESARS